MTTEWTPYPGAPQTRWPTYKACSHTGDYVSIRSYCDRVDRTFCTDCGQDVIQDLPVEGSTP